MLVYKPYKLPQSCQFDYLPQFFCILIHTVPNSPKMKKMILNIMPFTYSNKKTASVNKI